MKHRTDRNGAPKWIVDYSAARARAIKWLGDRYLLAKPINGSQNLQRGASGAHVQPQASG